MLTDYSSDYPFSGLLGEKDLFRSTTMGRKGIAEISTRAHIFALPWQVSLPRRRPKTIGSDRCGGVIGRARGAKNFHRKYWNMIKVCFAFLRSSASRRRSHMQIVVPRRLAIMMMMMMTYRVPLSYLPTKKVFVDATVDA